MKYEHIFKPITINKTEFANRLVVSAMVTDKKNFEAAATEFLKENPRFIGGGYRVSGGIPSGGNGGYNFTTSNLQIVPKDKIASNPIFVSKLDISPYGLRYFINDKKYVTINKDGSFTFKNNNRQLVIKDEGIYMSFDSEDNISSSSTQKVNSGKLYKYSKYDCKRKEC